MKSIFFNIENIDSHKVFYFIPLEQLIIVIKPSNILYKLKKAAMRFVYNTRTVLTKQSCNENDNHMTHVHRQTHSLNTAAQVH